MIDAPTPIILHITQVLFVIALSPILVGMMRQVRARMEGRVGAGTLQPWRDIRKLLKKERIRPELASWIFTSAPYVLLITSITAVAIVPAIAATSALNGSADFLVVVFLLLAGTVALALAGLDAGSAFGGMGSSREMTIAALAEPALLLGIFAVSVRADSSKLESIIRATIASPHVLLGASSLLALVALLIVSIAENGRIPVDNPSTHLELTMVHEAMTLDHAGRDLALIELSAHIRLVVYLTLITSLFFPFGIATSTNLFAIGIGVVSYVAKLFALGSLIAMLEVFLAKLRLFRIPELLAGAFVLAFLAVTISYFLA